VCEEEVAGDIRCKFLQPNSVGEYQPYEIQIWYYAGQREKKKIQFETGHREQLFFLFFFLACKTSHG
jgi:hypothetical protein